MLANDVSRAQSHLGLHTIHSHDDSYFIRRIFGLTEAKGREQRVTFVSVAFGWIGMLSATSLLIFAKIARLV